MGVHTPGIHTLQEGKVHASPSGSGTASSQAASALFFLTWGTSGHPVWVVARECFSKFVEVKLAVTVIINVQEGAEELAASIQTRCAGHGIKTCRTESEVDAARAHRSCGVQESTGLLSLVPRAIKLIALRLGHAGQAQRRGHIRDRARTNGSGAGERNTGRTKGLHDAGVFNAIQSVELTGQFLDGGRRLWIQFHAQHARKVGRRNARMQSGALHYAVHLFLGGFDGGAER